MPAGGKRRGSPKGSASKAKPSAAQNTVPVRARGIGKGRGRGRGRRQTRPVDEVSASSSDSEEEAQQQELDSLQAAISRRQLRQRSGSVRYDEGPTQQEGTGVLADDDSVEWEAAAPDV